MFNFLTKFEIYIYMKCVTCHYNKNIIINNVNDDDNNETDNVEDDAFIIKYPFYVNYLISSL